MRVLLTGAGGQLGQALQVSCPAAVTLLACGRPQLDLTAAATVAATLDQLQPQLVINTAAYTAVDRAEQDAQAAFALNHTAVDSLARQCAARGIAVLHLSTDFVFAGDGRRPLTEHQPAAPLSVYGRSKWLGEQALLEQLPGRSLVLRTSWLVSPYGHNFLLTMLRQMQAGRALTVVQDQTGSPTSALTLAGWIWQALPQLLHGRLSGLYHASGASACSWYELAVAIQQQALQLGLLERATVLQPVSAAEYGQGKALALRPAYSVLDSSAWYQRLGVEAAPWPDDIRHCLARLL